MLPPGKISGRTTNESVVNARREPFTGTDRAVVPLLEHGIGEGGHENLFDELMGEPSAAAVRQDDAIVSDSRDRTAQVERGRDFGVCHSGSRPRMRPRTIPWERPADFPACTSPRTPGTRAAS